MLLAIPVFGGVPLPAVDRQTLGNTLAKFNYGFLLSRISFGGSPKSEV